MDALKFALQLQAKQRALKHYVNDIWPVRAGNISLRFIDGNFRAQGWQGKIFERWKPNKRKGTILIKRGHLRAGNRYKAGIGEVRVYNIMKYARVHNEGFNGLVTIPAHQRRNYQAQRIATGRFTAKGRERMRTIHTVAGISDVREHTRRMNIPQRQFMPRSATDSPILANAIIREIEREIKNIFK